MAKVVILMADKGHDPTDEKLSQESTTVPYNALKKAGFDVRFATENGHAPECDAAMLRGMTQRLLGATSGVVKQYDLMAATEEFKNPVAWSKPEFTLDDYDLVFLPGGHEKGTKKPGKKALSAVCHGVMVLSPAKDAEGRSVIRDYVTVTLPIRFEQVAFWGTRAFLGDYYKTYGAGSENVEEHVVKALAEKKQYKCSLSPASFVVEDPNYNYISARFPGDAEVLGEKLVDLLKSLQ